MELLGSETGIGHRPRRRVGRHRDHRGAESPDDVKFAFRALERAAKDGVGGALEILKGLIQIDRDAEIAGDALHFAIGAAKANEVRFEELDGIEARSRDGLELVARACRTWKRWRGLDA